MRTIAVINQKGGVGKTACAYNLAYSFSKIRNTLLIDLDPSANATKGLDSYNKSDLSTYHFLLQKGDINRFAVMPYEGNTNLWLVPSHIKLAMAQNEIQSKAFRETIIASKLYSGGAGTYITFIDCPPTLTELTINAIYAADFILIPVSYEEDALEGLGDLFTIIKEIKPRGGYEFRILKTQKDIRKKRTVDYIEDKLKEFEERGHVLKTVIRQDENIHHAKIERKTIFEFAPKSNGAEDFKNLTEELLNVEKQIDR